MGLFSRRKGLYLQFTCLKCYRNILLEIRTDTLKIIKASIREPDYCVNCQNRTRFKYNGISVRE